MDSFPFTRKKLLSLPPARQHKWVAKWLKDVYSGLVSGTTSDAALEITFQNLAQLHVWMSIPSPSDAAPPEDRRGWIEFIADAFHEHQKMTGLGLSEPDLLPNVLTGDKASDKPWEPEIPYRVALDNLRSAFNVGSIFRLIDGAGFESILMSKKTPGPETRQVQKTAMGATKWIPGVKTDDLSSELMTLKDSGYHIIGLETVDGSENYRSYPWPRRGVVVVGNEEYGITGDALKACDDCVHIPMSGNKNSINVANAFAVVAFHICALFDNK